MTCNHLPPRQAVRPPESEPLLENNFVPDARGNQTGSADVKKKSALTEIWHLFTDYEDRRLKLQSEVDYILQNLEKMQQIVRLLGLDYNEIGHLSAEELRMRSDLHPVVLDYFLRSRQAFADREALDAAWESLTRRVREHLTGAAACLGLAGVCRIIFGRHDQGN